VPGAVLRGVTLDCADPRTLAGFYGALTGMRELFSTDEFVALTDDSGCDLGFQRVDGYRAPQWPGQDVARPNRTISPATDAGGYSWIRLATPSA
jgi:hypothetical protein